MLFTKGDITSSRRLQVGRAGAEICGFVPNGRSGRRCRSFALDIGTVLTCLGFHCTSGDGPALF
jgi:hypothetical protein